jgi:hypothetical protein
MRSGAVTFEDGAQGDRIAQVALLDAVQPGIIEKPLRTINPPAPTRKVTLVQQLKGQPERATRRACYITDPSAITVRSRPGFNTVLGPTDQIRGDRKPLQVLQLERVLDIRGQEVPTCRAPCLALEGLPTLINPFDHAESLAQTAPARLFDDCVGPRSRLGGRMRR